MPPRAAVRKLDPKAARILRRSVRLARGAPAGARSANWITRATTIIGLMLEGLSDDYASRKKTAAAALAWCGHMSWGLVELAAPRHIATVLFQYWIWLILALSACVTVIGVLTTGLEGMTRAGAAAGAAAAITGLLARALRKWLRRARWVYLVALPLFVAPLLWAIARADWQAVWLHGRFTYDYRLTAAFVLWAISGGVVFAYGARRVFPRPHVAVALVAALALVTGAVEAASHARAWLDSGGACCGTPAVSSTGLWFVRATLLALLCLFAAAVFGAGSALAHGWPARPRSRAVSPARQRLHSLAAALPPRPDRPIRALSPGATAILRRTIQLASGAPDRFPAARWSARAIQIFGAMLQELTTRKLTIAAGMAAWITRSGRVLRALVEFATPNTLGASFLGYWLWLIYALVAILVAAGALVGAAGLVRAGLLAAAAALVFQFAVGLLRASLRRTRAIYGGALPVALLSGACSVYLVVAMNGSGACEMIRELAYAESPEQAQELLAGTTGADREQMASVLGLDSLFVPAYILLLCSGALLFGSLTGVSSRRSLSVLPVAALALTAGAIDLLENARVWLLLKGFRLVWPGPVTDYKWGTLAAALLWLAAVALVAGLRRSPPGPPARATS
jgi:hypothetical protein